MLKYAMKIHMGHFFVVMTGIVRLFMNLGTRKKGELSAYSIFNKGGKKLAGTFDVGQIEQNLRGAGIEKDASENEDEDQQDPKLPQTQLNKISKMSNQPCYCGSGKKYKKCCYWRELRQRQVK